MIDFQQRPLQKNIKPVIRPEKTVSRMIDGFIMPFFGLFNKWRRCKNMENNIFGYARVSSRDQNEERQVIALLEMGVPE